MLLLLGAVTGTAVLAGATSSSSGGGLLCNRQLSAFPAFVNPELCHGCGGKL